MTRYLAVPSVVSLDRLNKVLGRDWKLSITGVQTPHLILGVTTLAQLVSLPEELLYLGLIFGLVSCLSGTLVVIFSSGCMGMLGQDYSGT